MTTKLIIVEGLPGSGKSTTARMVHDILQANQVESEIFCEGNLNHPADYDGVAYFNEDEFYKLEQRCYKNKDILDRIKTEHLNGYLIPYGKVLEEQDIKFDDELLKEITKNDIYELPMDIHRSLILKRWEDFVHRYRNKDQVVIFECCFIQNPVTVTMIRNNAAKEVTMNYISHLAKIITPLEPILIYVDQKDVEASFKRVVEERPKEWFEGFRDYYTKQGYGFHNNYKGMDGIIDILESRKAFEQEIYQSLSLEKYKIDNSALDRDSHKEEINAILKAHLTRGQGPV